MARYGRDFMGRVRGMWERFAGEPREPVRRRPMEATGPGGEGYFLTHDMVRQASYGLDYSDHGRDDVREHGFLPGGMAQFGRAGAGRGYGGDYRTGRGGYDAGDFFVNRGRGGETGYHAGYERDLGMRRGMTADGRGYGGGYLRGGSIGYDGAYRGGGSSGYDRGYRGGQMDRGRGYGGDYRDVDSGLPSGRNRTSPPYPRGR